MAETDAVGLVRKYLMEVAVQWKTGQATEHSYRPALKTLLEWLLPKVIVINEPQHIACGAPDYILRDRRTALHLGFIEAKDVGDGDLDGNGVHKEQFNRYRNSLESLCFTDYLDFHFYEGGVFKDKVRIAEVCGDRIVSASDETLEKFLGFIAHFGSTRPQRITSPVRLAHLMAGKARLLARAIREYLAQDTERQSMLAEQMQAFREVLIHDIDEESFADVYAQTITYGMFAARLHDTTPEDFSRAEAAALIPKTNPLLRQMFNYIAADTNETVEWIVDDLVTLFAATDLAAIMKDYGKDTEQTDPILHFYEDFLAAYNPDLRKQRGVWYTPQPVVGFIVRSVDRILETSFGLQGGLANNSKAKFKVVNDNRFRKSDAEFVEREMHRVQILDPATGTGTFLAETVRQIHAKFAGMQGMWQNYVSEHLLPRLNGFEILMASYAMAHLKLDLLLSETGYRHESNERLRVFLTNSLEEHDKEVGTLFAAALSREANEANFLKRDCPVMVVLGNPPYSGISSNNGEWISKLITDYKREPGTEKPLNERKQWLNDDYVKFVRMAQYYVERNGFGIVAFINNNGFIDNPTFRGMRWSLLNAFDEIYILNLHGNSTKKESAPDGTKDENVFDIMVGTSINIFVKHEDKIGCLQNEKCRDRARVFYADVYGAREQKYSFLGSHSIDDVDFTEVFPSKPFFFFSPKNEDGREEYEKGFKLDELMTVTTSGFVSANDVVNISFSEAEQREKIDDLLNMEESSWRTKYSRAKDSRDWTFRTARADAAKSGDCHSLVSYRPFDVRHTFYSGNSRGLYSSPQQNVMSQFIRGDNLGLCAIRINSRDDNCPAYVTDKITDKTILSSKDNANVFPLYLYDDNLGQVEKKPNLNPEIVAKINEIVGNEHGSMAKSSEDDGRACRSATAAPEDIFHYVYAVLYTPEYRARYREFLKVDFPRIPYPKDGEAFRRLAEIGRQLVAVHLLKDAVTGNMFDPRAQFPVEGDNRVSQAKFADGRVFINDVQYFDNVPEAAWNFFIGGYQPAQKWLKDRKGRVLSADDILHYKSIILALLETARLMGELSKVSETWVSDSGGEQ